MVETITVPANSLERITLDDGETFSNVRFDLNEDGAGANITATATNWTIENVAFDGEYGYESRPLTLADTGGGHSVVRNVYCGDGVQPDRADDSRFEPKFGLWVAPEHSGELDIEGVYMAGAMDNGFYGSAPGSNSNGQGGEVNYYNCVGEDNMISHFRTAGGRVENCVAVNRTDGLVNPRPLWVWGTVNDGPVSVVNCDFDEDHHGISAYIGRDGYHTDITMAETATAGDISIHPGGTVDMDDRGGNISNFRDRAPDGCPMTADDALDAENEPDEPLDHDLTFGGRFEYRIEVDGEIEPHPDIAQWLTEGEAYGDDWAEWYLTGSETQWRFSGEITAFETSPYDGEESFEYLTIDGENLSIDEALAWPDHDEADDGDETDDETVAELEAEIDALEDEVAHLESELAEANARIVEYREAVTEVEGDLTEMADEKDGMIQTLRGLLG